MSECPQCGYQLTPSNMARARRLPVDWKPTEKMVAKARELRPDVDPNREAILFRNYWTTKAGKDAAKLDWERTWESWIIKAQATPGFTARVVRHEAHESKGPRLTEAQREQNRKRLAEMLNGFASGAVGPDTSGAAVVADSTPARAATE